MNAWTNRRNQWRWIEYLHFNLVQPPAMRNVIVLATSYITRTDVNTCKRFMVTCTSFTSRIWKTSRFCEDFTVSWHVCEVRVTDVFRFDRNLAVFRDEVYGPFGSVFLSMWLIISVPTVNLLSSYSFHPPWKDESSIHSYNGGEVETLSPWSLLDSYTINFFIKIIDILLIPFFLENCSMPG